MMPLRAVKSNKVGQKVGFEQGGRPLRSLELDDGLKSNQHWSSARKEGKRFCAKFLLHHLFLLLLLLSSLFSLSPSPSISFRAHCSSGSNSASPLALARGRALSLDVDSMVKLLSAGQLELVSIL